MSVLATMPPGVAPALSLPELFPPSDRTLPKMLRRQAERYGDRRLVTIGSVSMTYTDTLAAAAGYAGALAAAGTKPGDRVAIMCGNRVELLLTILGCAWLGAIAVPINTASRGAQLAHILGNCGARLMVIERELAPVLATLTRRQDRLGDALAGRRRTGAGREPVAVRAVPGAGSERAAVSARPRRYARDPLHLGHDRPLQGRVLPARAILLVGGLHRRAVWACATATC